MGLTHQGPLRLQNPGACWTRRTPLVARNCGSHVLRASEVEWLWGTRATSVTRITPCTTPTGSRPRKLKWGQAERTVSLKSPGTSGTQASLHGLGSRGAGGSGSSRTWLGAFCNGLSWQLAGEGTTVRPILGFSPGIVKG